MIYNLIDSKYNLFLRENKIKFFEKLKDYFDEEIEGKLFLEYANSENNAISNFLKYDSDPHLSLVHCCLPYFLLKIPFVFPIPYILIHRPVFPLLLSLRFSFPVMPYPTVIHCLSFPQVNPPL